MLEYGYLCVGRCAYGTGNQYFLKTSASDDPPLVQIAHDAGAKADLILQNGVIENRHYVVWILRRREDQVGLNRGRTSACTGARAYGDACR